MRIVVTGGAGFIGSHLVRRLLRHGHEVLAVDSFDPFYSPERKRRNLAPYLGEPAFRLVEADIRDPEGIDAALGSDPVDALVHLAARSGVRASIAEPQAYTAVNVGGTTAMLELARRRGIARFVFGSSSSVYGDLAELPFSEEDPVGRPLSPYAATKRAGELLCHSYHHLYGISAVCLRFFTVYGPRQRPDLAIHKFARLLSERRPIPLYGDGSTGRDYTYVDDVLDGIEGALAYTAAHPAAFEILNLGSGRTTSLATLVELVAEAMGVEPEVERLPPHPGDVHRTRASIRRARELLGYAPTVGITEGVHRFVDWLRAEELSAS